MASDLPPLPAPPSLAPAVAALAPTLAESDPWGVAPPRLDWQIGLAPALRRALADLAQRASAIAAEAAREPHRAVHAQRRTLRRGRALLRLLGPCLAPPQAKAWLDRLGDASRQLGVFRDAEVLPATLGLLGDTSAAAIAPLHAHLSAAREQARRDPEALRLVQHTAEVLVAVAVEAQRAAMQPTPARLARGLQASMQRARALARQANKHPRAEAVHALRKRAKDLRHQLEWLGVGRGDPGLEELIDWLADLGEVADLLALHAWLKQQRGHAALDEALLAALRHSKAKRARRCLRDAKAALPGKSKRRARAVLLAALGELPAP